MRASGILMHITSLPSPYGIGTLGAESYRFVDFLKESGQSFWQVLPVLTTGFGDSPYQSFSTFAGNPYLIDLDFLERDGLLYKEEYADTDFGSDPARVDYFRLFRKRSELLRKAYARGDASHDARFASFCEKHADWLDDYALFMALKANFGHRSYHEWPKPARQRDPESLATYRVELREDIEFHRYVQYLFFRQWRALKEYANKKGVRIIGDIPIYVADDSADTWSHPELFWLDENCVPVRVAGVPPDAFTADGQLWGNPLYDWEVHEKTGYAWWHKRLLYALDMYDVVRIDHFRGFASYYSIPYGDTTARNGEWLRGPGLSIFRGIRSKLRGFRIIAEDLGYMDDSVRRLLAESGFPGMKIMLFGFDADSSTDDVPYQHSGHCVSYIGTHDNETFAGWFRGAPPAVAGRARRYMRLNAREGYNWGAIRTLLSTGAELTILTMQDLLGLDNEARMNTPSTVGGNWQWRLLPDWPRDIVSTKLFRLTKTYGRLPTHVEKAPRTRK